MVCDHLFDVTKCDLKILEDATGLSRGIPLLHHCAIAILYYCSISIQHYYSIATFCGRKLRPQILTYHRSALRDVRIVFTAGVTPANTGKHTKRGSDSLLFYRFVCLF